MSPDRPSLEPCVEGFEPIAEAADDSITPIMQHLTHIKRSNDGTDQ